MHFPSLSIEKLKLFRRLRQKKFRKEKKVYLIEGHHLFEEFLHSRETPVWIAVTESYLKSHPEVHTRLQTAYRRITYIAQEQQLYEISETEQPQGIVAALRATRPDIQDLMKSTQPQPILALDRIADPGNLGTIIRCADWFGSPHIVLNPDCVEWYNPKVVRGSMGSIFRVKGYTDIPLKEFLLRMQKKNYTTYAAVLDPRASSEFVQPDRKTILVIGNEADGIDPEIEKICMHTISIPRYGQAESLNAAVASAILLNNLMKQIFFTHSNHRNL